MMGSVGAASDCSAKIFTTTDDEIQFLRRRNHELLEELEEFQDNSKELEQELEAQLKQSDKRNKELTVVNAKLETETDSLRNKLNKISHESQHQILELQKELGETMAANERLSRYIRELEQSNDDLERAKRALAASLEDFESRLNHQIERNVLLENELGEKEELEVVVQRLKDEARDLRCELMVQQQQPPSDSRRSSLASSYNSSPQKSNKLSTPLSPSSQLDNKISGGTPPKSNRLYYTSNNVNLKNCSLNTQSIPNSPSTGQVPQQPLPLLSPSTRISALNIVSDLLRKVGALESKLASCRNFAPGTPKSKSSAVSTPITSPSTLKDVGREISNKD